MLRQALIIIFLIYVLQSTLAWLQIKRAYKIINDIRAQYQGDDCRMITGTGRTKFFLIQKGYYLILVVNEEDEILDYYSMEGFTVFATPTRKEQYIGMTLDEVEATFKKKNAKRAIADAKEQLSILRENALQTDEL